LLSTSCCKIILSNQILKEKLRNRSWVIEMQVWAYEYHTYFQLAHSNTVKFLHWLRIRSKANHEFLRLSTTPQILNESSHSHDRPHGFFFQSHNLQIGAGKAWTTFKMHQNASCVDVKMGTRQFQGVLAIQEFPAGKALVCSGPDRQDCNFPL
jgi:hypothetical protein